MHFRNKMKYILFIDFMTIFLLLTFYLKLTNLWLNKLLLLYDGELIEK